MSVKKKYLESCDQIHIEGLEVSCQVGVTKEERSLPQDLNLSLTLSAPLQKAGRSDKLGDTVDYAQIMVDVRRLLQGRSFHLIEAVAEQTAAFVLKRFNIKKVIVNVSKRTLPGVKSVTVSLTRSSSRDEKTSK